MSGRDGTGGGAARAAPDAEGVVHRLQDGQGPAARRRPGQPGGKGAGKGAGKGPGRQGKGQGAGKGQGGPVPPGMAVQQAAQAQRPAPRPPAPPQPDILIEIADPTSAARVRRADRRRRIGVWLSFLLLVVAPTALASWYLFEKAADQYVSTVAFAVRSADAAAPSPMLEILGGAPDAAAADSRILYEYLQSQPLVERIDDQLDLRAMYRREGADWLFRLGDDPSVETLVDYWNLAQTVSYDSSAGIIYAEIRAFDPDDAHAVATAVTAESERLINALSEKSRKDAVEFALADLREAEARVREVRLDLQSFRGAAGTADVSLDIQSSMGLVGELRARRADLAAERDSRRDMLGADSPVLAALDRRLAALDVQIAQEEARVASAGTDGAPADGSLADAAGRQEELMVEREFAENMYTAALAAVEIARAEARRAQRYLAIHIAPTRAQMAEHPRRWVLSIATGALCLVLWSILQLIASSIRDRS
ncbi:hypothetical protein ACQ5SO_12135 [Rhodovulum sp. DZ06]|uniref:hypothetical protein n=1 Tax=Rhodovulum sp. DZ06 TaxID=3425126 RepID=UPI003D3371A7